MNSANFPWLRILVFCTAAGLLLRGLGGLFDFAARQDLRVKAHWLLAQEGGAYDFAVLGPSRPYVGVDIAQLEKQLGGRGINLSLDGAGYPEQLLALRAFIQRNQLRHLLLDVNLSAWDPGSLTYPFHDYDYLPFRGDPVIEAALLGERGRKALVWKHVPFWQNAEFNTKMGPIQLYTWGKSRFDPRARVAEFDRHGSCLTQAPFNLRGARDPVRWKIEPRLIAAFLDIIECAQSHGIPITLTLTPEWRPYSRLQLNRQELLDRHLALARERGLTFLIFDGLPWLEDTAYFTDPSHLNSTGARLYTHELATRLQAPGGIAR